MRSSSWLTAAALALLAAPLRPQVPPGTDPVAGPIEVFVNALTASAEPGGFEDAEIDVVNSSGSEVRVVIRASITYADGTKQKLQLGGPQLIPPNGALVLIPFFPVPSDAALGTATIQGI